jgi:hypothetical protein
MLAYMQRPENIFNILTFIIRSLVKCKVNCKNQDLPGKSAVRLIRPFFAQMQGDVGNKKGRYINKNKFPNYIFKVKFEFLLIHLSNYLSNR